MKLLLVEDNNELRETLADILEISGILFDAAKNVDNALRLIDKQNNSYQLILSDYLMPGKSGLEFLEIIKSKKEYHSTPFYIMSARTDKEVKHKFKEKNITGFVDKPFEINELLDIIRKHLE